VALAVVDRVDTNSVDVQLLEFGNITFADAAVGERVGSVRRTTCRRRIIRRWLSEGLRNALPGW